MALHHLQSMSEMWLARHPHMRMGDGKRRICHPRGHRIQPPFQGLSQVRCVEYVECNPGPVRGCCALAAHSAHGCLESAAAYPQLTVEPGVW
jgi:hypothetical protein